MLSYRHAYHAGNFADVQKHAVVALLADALCRKDKPWFFLDTHAAAGHYDLSSEAVRHGAEYERGILRLWRCADAPFSLRPYIAAVAAANGAATPAPLRRYPGSPRIVRHFMREHDRMTLCELHPQEIENLRAEFAGERNVSVLHGDGYQALHAQLPPKERRGLVLIDPSYERADEWERAIDALQAAYSRWPTGIYALWYPIQERARIERFHKRLRAAGMKKILCAELWVYPDDTSLRLNGSGMIVINPPWQIDAAIGEAMEYLWGVLSPEGVGGKRVEWLVGE